MGAAAINSIVREHLPATFFREYQALRDQLMEILTDEDLSSHIGEANLSLGALCREIGEIEHSYIQSFTSFTMDLGYRNPDPQLEDSVASLSSWYTKLDGELTEAIEGLSEDEIANRRIDRADFPDWKPLPQTQLDIYKEALLIFYAKVSVYLRAMGKPLPQQWRQWIG